MSKLRGNPIEERNGVWVYSDTGEPTAETYRDRPCGLCGLPYTPEGHDGCLGTLPGVMNACCGHGDTDEAYVQFGDGSRIAGDEAIAYQAHAARYFVADIRAIVESTE